MHESLLKSFPVFMHKGSFIIITWCNNTILLADALHLQTAL